MKAVMFVFFVVLTFSSCFLRKEVHGDCVEIVDPECACTMQYDPVCGCNQVTYGNACVAECSNILDYTPGPCSK